MSTVKIWFITGASSGFGRAMTEYILSLGHKVVATLRSPTSLSDLTARYPPAQLLVLKLDVTNPAEVTSAFAAAQATFGRIDVVFNNAGVSIPAEVESMPEITARETFNVNFWGAMYVSREAVKFFREVNKPMGGRLLQVSSRLGLVGKAASGFYGASKFALEGLSECLADELDPAWNIKVTLIEPGPYRTAIIQSNPPWLIPQHPAYTSPSLSGTQFRKFLESFKTFDGDVQKAVKVIEKLTNEPLEEMPLRFPLHRRVVEALRTKAKDFVAIADKYESWNEDLYHEN